MSSLAKKSMNFMRDVYNLAENRAELLLSTTTTPTSTSSQGYHPSQGLSSQFNPAHTHQYPPPPPPPPPALHTQAPPPPTYHYSSQHAQPYGHWSGPLTPISLPLPQAAPNVYPVASAALDVHPNQTPGLPLAPPSPVSSPPIPQPYGHQTPHGQHQYPFAQEHPPSGPPSHHQHPSSWQNPVNPGLHHQPQRNASVAAQSHPDFGPNRQDAAHQTSSSKHSAVTGSYWGMSRPETSKPLPPPLPPRANADGRYVAPGWVGAASSEPCAPVSDQHGFAPPAPGYHEMPAVAAPPARRHHHSATNALPELPELPTGAADMTSSQPAHHASYHLGCPPAAELQSNNNCAFEAVELPASPVMAKASHFMDSSSSAPQRYQRAYSTATTPAAMNQSFTSVDVAELDSTPITLSSQTTTNTTTAMTTSKSMQHRPPMHSNNAVTFSPPASSGYHAYPVPTTLSSFGDDPPQRPPSPAMSPSAHTHSRSSIGADHQQQQQGLPLDDTHQMLQNHRVVSSPVVMSEVDRLAFNHAQARTASLPTPGPTPCPNSLTPSRSETQHPQRTKVPYPLYHGTGAVTMPLHQDFATWNADGNGDGSASGIASAPRMRRY
ncbi:uncharacterized protein A1O5_02591 [Cladophialophora psammophila CBS 110553]|uniref:Uncharacterized protein n=1 Tax=Cladophialophora psammophila CBS 110553 TaxID=1182543 RepID=W9XAC0_9EURO|nr:uncharacterized protein A1O5_02591 [Cladophialophora psammophila CBS 110553]EXJ74295.1 hypothetical protein A1O5_02591 [Cladophialophora psammophila CBS 110553]